MQYESRHWIKLCQSRPFLSFPIRYKAQYVQEYLKIPICTLFRIYRYLLFQIWTTQINTIKFTIYVPTVTCPCIKIYSHIEEVVGVGENAAGVTKSLKEWSHTDHCCQPQVIPSSHTHTAQYAGTQLRADTYQGTNSVCKCIHVRRGTERKKDGTAE